jgi:tRNA dimethylallyltransferase
MDNHPSWMSVEKKPLIVIIGPTAVGKTEIAIEIAERVDGEIISADSRLFYRGMDIGTAKPSKEDQKRVRHYLIDVSDPDDNWSLGRYKKNASKIIDDIHRNYHRPFLVGGTGQYIRAVVEGWEIPEVKPNTELRKALENWASEIGKQNLHEKLRLLDPDAGRKIEPENLRRTVRALEVILSSGRRFSEQTIRIPPPYQTLIIGLIRPRLELFARVDDRIEGMLENGFIEEVKKLLDKGYSPDLPTLSAIGYREIISYLENKLSLSEAKAEIQRKTRIFIRRQANWFKSNDPNINWFNVNHETVNDLFKLINDWMQKAYTIELDK